MKVGISTASIFDRRMLEDIPEVLRSFGCDIAEVYLNSFCEYTPSFIALLKSRLEAAGLPVYSVHPMSTMFEAQLFSVHPRQKQDAFSVYRQVLAGARELGAKIYVMHGSPHLNGAMKNIQLERIAPIFTELLDTAEEYGVQLCLENVSWCFCHEPGFAKELGDRIGGGRLKYVLDIKQAVRSGEDPFAFVETLGRDILDVHLCDYVYEDGRLKLRMPGEGCFDFAALARALSEKGSQAPCFIEVYSDMYREEAELKTAFLRMRELLKEI